MGVSVLVVVAVAVSVDCAVELGVLVGASVGVGVGVGVSVGVDEGAASVGDGVGDGVEGGSCATTLNGLGLNGSPSGESIAMDPISRQRKIGRSQTRRASLVTAPPGRTC